MANTTVEHPGPVSVVEFKCREPVGTPNGPALPKHVIALAQRTPEGQQGRRHCPLAKPTRHHLQVQGLRPGPDARSYTIGERSLAGGWSLA